MFPFRFGKSPDWEAAITNDGDITMITPTRIKMICENSNYTEDGTMSCAIMLGSWNYNGNVLDLIGGTINTDSFIPRRWVIDSYNSTRNVIYYSCCPEPYPDVTFTIVFKDTHREPGWSIFKK